MLIGIAVSLGIFWLMCNWLGLPAHVKFNTLLLTEPAPARAIVGVGGALCLSTMLASIFVGRLRHDAGLLCAAFGLAMVAWHGGRMQHVYLDHSEKSIFLTMAIETVVLYAIVSVAWMILRIGKSRGLLSDRLKLTTVKEESLSQKLWATLMQAVVMGVMLKLLMQSDDKLQALLSIGAAAYIGSLIAHQMIPTQPSTWFWAAPGLLAVVTYLFSYLFPDTTHLSIGYPTGPLSQLLRAAPIDYASAGTIGSLLGYWTRQQSHAIAAESEDQDETATAM